MVFSDRVPALVGVSLSLLVPLSACSPGEVGGGDELGDTSSDDPGDTGTGTAGGTGTTSGTEGDADTASEGGDCDYCEGALFYPCEGQGAGEPVDCDRGGELCVDGLGCRPCAPGSETCQGDAVYTCDEDGQPGALVDSCDAEAGELCDAGACVSACELAAATPSNLGCEFWAVDLPNSRGLDEAAAEPWAVIVANAGEVTAELTIERDLAALGEPPDIAVVVATSLPPGGHELIELPRAEVTGWTQGTLDPPGPTGTAHTNHGFRITSTAPIVAYQFNPWADVDSNDASLLLPAAALGTVHRVVGYPTANPTAPLPLEGLPDRASVTVLGTEDGTEVTIRPATTTASDMQSIPTAAPGEELLLELDMWEVINISSEGMPGDMSGTVVETDKPVAVFSAGERALAPAMAPEGIPAPPGWDPGDLCCTDHIEEQVFPASSLGSDFVVPHSPMRNDGGFIEPDILRFMAVAEPAMVSTSLPPPRDQFTLQPGEMFETWTQEDIIVQSSAPIMVAQILVSQAYTDASIGDPSLTYFPPVDQYRDRYVFLTPPTWTLNYFVLTTPYEDGGDWPPMGNVTLDGGGLPDACVEQVVGELNNVEYWSIVCPVEEGAHLIEGDGKFGLTVYGYGSAGSYAYTGGADVKPIYDVPPIP